MKALIILYLLSLLILLIGCSNININNGVSIPNGQELRPSEPIATSAGDIYMPQSFGTMVNWGYESLVEFTVLSITRVEGEVDSEYLDREDAYAPIWGVDYYYLLVLYIDDILMEGSNWGWPSKGDEVDIVVHPTSPLEEGQSYLTFINPSSLDGRFISKINNDRTITAIPTGNYFREYDGYTVEQMREIAEEYRTGQRTVDLVFPEGSCVELPPGVVVAPEPLQPGLQIVKPGSNVVIEGHNDIDILDEAWDLGLD
jgi:hypothetical protein